ncbi:MAG: HTTM domain-containing protein [Flavobacteriales bacterium]|jgi:hypothetical protein|nr:HTTM domain-containing protein [Flavobacteriales bacterium]MBK6754890.1 HTTM domain-containing protein [Flavobacteriales bacterium]MBK7083997.1 HTTM domain-containing protein [Flavobacteriales bacterium]MBK7753144.1 HTTM domain-containing protein [Flavobacteriales bacterium]MBK9075001.1 HTTM domain-containing protein [Flavobacteriales bacterium]
MKALDIRVMWFQRALHLWLLVWLLSALPAAEWLWEHPVSPELGDPGIVSGLLHGFGVWMPSGAAVPVAIALLLFAVIGAFKSRPWWIGALTWLFFCALTDRAWLANNGGTWLMRNALFWSIFLRVDPSKEHGPLSLVPIQVLRLQLLLAYAITGLQKLHGTTWTDGTALGIIASDPTYGPSLLPVTPGLCWAVLLFQLTFPLAVWWGPTRIVWLAAGVVFHLGTAFWLGIVDMAFAFLVFYLLWFPEEGVAWMMRSLRITSTANTT